MLNQFYRKYWRESFQDWLFIVGREARRVFRDEGALLFFIFLPLFYPVLYSLIYTTETIKQVPVAVVDDSRTNLSREYLRKVDATRDVRIVSVCANMEEAKELVRRREAYGIIFVPSGFKNDIVAHRQSRVHIFCDMSGLLYYKAILTANTDVSLTMNAHIKAERAGNFTAEQDKMTQQPIAYETVSIYNPQTGMASFILPAVLILILQQSLLLGVGLLAGTTREKNTLRELIPVEHHHNGLLRIVFGKAFVYLTIYVVQSVYCLGIIPRVFALPQIGNPLTLAFFLLPLLLSVVFFAMTLSALIRERENVILILVFTSLILLFISGISWPGAVVPKFWKMLSYIFPSTFGINGFVRINTMGADLLSVRKEWDALWLLTAFYFITCCISFRVRILRARAKTYNAIREKRHEKTEGAH